MTDDSMVDDGVSHNSVLCLGGSTESLHIIQRILSMGYRPVILDGDGACAAAKWASSNFPRFKRQPLKGSDNNKRYMDSDVCHIDGAIFLKADCYDSWQAGIQFGYYKSHRAFYEGFVLDNDQFRNAQYLGVICCATDAPDVQAMFAEKLHLPTIGKEAARLGKNKYWQYEALKRAGVPVPRTRLASAETSIDELDGYSLVKPVDSRGARGVLRFTPDTFHAMQLQSVGNSKQLATVVQEWLDGVQLSTESVIYDGVAVFTAVVVRNYSRLEETYPYVIEDGVDGDPQWVNDNPNLMRQIRDVLEQSCRALGWNNCTVKGDLVIYNGVVYVIELAPRLSGGYFATHTIPSVCGWDIVQDAILLAVGQKPKIELVARGKPTVQRYLFPKPEWIGKRVKNIFAHTVMPELLGIRDFATYGISPGQVITKTISHPQRLGQVIANGDTLQEARRNAESIIQAMSDSIEVE